MAVDSTQNAIGNLVALLRNAYLPSYVGTGSGVSFHKRRVPGFGARSRAEASPVPINYHLYSKS